MCFFFLLIFILMSMQVFTRYLFGITFAWNEEMARYTFVWLTFIGAAYARKQKAHIRIEIVYEIINKRLSKTGTTSIADYEAGPNHGLLGAIDILRLRSG